MAEVDNPYKPPEYQGKETVRSSASLVRIVIGIVASLFGIGFFGLGIYAAWKTTMNTVATTSTHRWLIMVGVSVMYLTFGLSFFASSRCIFLEKSGTALCLFIAPFLFFGILLVVFGV